MNRLLIALRFVLPALLTVVLIGPALTGCGDDEPTAPVELDGVSNITMMHANPGFANDVYFFRGSSTTLNVALTYGNFSMQEIPNGNSVTLTAKGTDGTKLTSTSSKIDSGLHHMVIFTGSATSNELFVASTADLTDIGAGNAAVRFIHAEKDAKGRNLRLNNTNGPLLTASEVVYKKGSAFVTVPVSSTESFWIVNASDPDAAIQVDATGLEEGNYYAVVLHGAKAAVTQATQPKGTLVKE